MGKRKNLTKAEKKAKRRKVWGTILLCFGAFMVAEGLVLGIVLHEIPVLLCMGIEGGIVLGLGIVLRNLSKRVPDDKAEDKATETTANVASEEQPQEVRYRIKDIIDEETRKEIYQNLDTLARIYKNFFGEKNPTTVKLQTGMIFLCNPDYAADRSTWMETANFLEETAKMQQAANYKDAFVTRGANAIRTFLADKENSEE